MAMLNAIAVMPFATDIMQTVECFSQGLVCSRSAKPPQTSTTVLPFLYTQQADPVSSPTP